MNPKSPLGQCQHAATSDKGVPQCTEQATTRIGGLPLCKEHGDRSAMRPQPAGIPFFSGKIVASDAPAPTDKDSLEVPTLWRDIKPGEMTQPGDRYYSSYTRYWKPVQNPGSVIDEDARPHQRPEPTNWQARAEDVRDQLLSAFSYFMGGWNATLGVHAGRLKFEPQYHDDSAIARKIINDISTDVAEPLKKQIGELKAELSASQAEVERLRGILNEAGKHLGEHAYWDSPVMAKIPATKFMELHFDYNQSDNTWTLKALSPAEKGGGVLCETHGMQSVSHCDKCANDRQEKGGEG